MALSAYEAKRQRRIEANQRQLQALNVPRLELPTRSTARQKRVLESVEPVRRSLRQRQKGVETVSPPLLDPVPSRPKRIKQEKSSLQPLELPKTNLHFSESSGQNMQVHLSSSQIEISMEDFHTKWLGTQLLPVGKQTVMQGLCPPGFVAKFSKMSGVQPWKNAIALFVNVESDSFYDNTFHQEDLDGHDVVHFHWFGQNRWHEETPMVKRLRGVKRGDERLKFDESYHQKENDKDEPLLLFLRHTLGPYVYCGQLGYLGHRPASKPLEFRWQLLDVGALQWDKVRELLVASDFKAETVKQES